MALVADPRMSNEYDEPMAAAPMKKVTIDADSAPNLSLPNVHKSLAHTTTHDRLDPAISQLITPYTGVAGRKPTLHDLYLTPNASVVDDDQRLAGFVATVDGSAPAAPLVTERLGTGTTWLRLEETPSLSSLEKSFAPQLADGAQMLVAVVKGNEYPSQVHYIVVAGNDRESARALATKAEREHLTIDDVVSGSLRTDYQAVMRRSKEARMRTMAQFMSAHTLESAGSAEGDAPSDFVTKVSALSTQAQSSRVAGRNVYAAYSHAADPSDAKSGLMVYRGAIAGFSLVRAQVHSAGGKPSLAFSNERADRPFSVFPVDTGRFSEADRSVRTVDRHRDSSEAVRAAHDRRVKWAGKLSSYNPYALDAYHSPEDLHIIQAHQELGLKAGSSVSQQHLDTLVCEVPSLVTKHLSLDRLVDIAHRSSERALPVGTESFLNMLAAWPDASAQRLSDLFATQEGDTVDVDTDLIKAIHTSVRARE